MILVYQIPKAYKVSTNDIYNGKVKYYTTKEKLGRVDIAHFFHDIVLPDRLKVDKFITKVDIDFLFYFKSKYLDSSNCSFMGKCLEDGLRKIGVFKDDSNKYVGRFSCESILIEPKERKKMTGDYVEIHIKERDCQ